MTEINWGKAYKNRTIVRLRTKQFGVFTVRKEVTPATTGQCVDHIESVYDEMTGSLQGYVTLVNGKVVHFISNCACVADYAESEEDLEILRFLVDDAK